MESRPDQDSDPSLAPVARSPAAPSFPAGRVKRIVKLDREIKKVNGEALHVISLAADLFLAALADGASSAAVRKKRRVIKLDHLWSAARAHPPTADFLLDCLDPAPAPAPVAAKSRSAPPEKPLPPGARRIDDFFGKSSAVP